jgi:hypothetical protein
MNAKFWIAICLTTTTATTVSMVSSNFFPQPTQAQTTDSSSRPTDRVSFYCGEISGEDGEKIPTTIAYVPQRKADIAVIAWKSDYIPQWDAQKRCDTVSPKFQAFYEDGRLNYLATGENQGYPIICAATEVGQPCQGENQLFQVKASDNPNAVLEGLTGIIEGESSEPIYQSSGEQAYVSMQKLLDAAPAIETDIAQP